MAVDLKRTTAVPYFIALDATNVYWIAAGVMKCAKSGCGGNATTFVANSGGWLVVDSANVYWATWDSQNKTSAVVKCAIGGCGGNPTTVVSVPNEIDGLALDATSVYFTSYDAQNNKDGVVMRFTPK